MEFKIRVDKQSKHIIAHLNDFDEAIEFIKNNDCDGLQIGGIIGQEEIEPDFKKFRDVCDKIVWLSFSMHQRAKKIHNFEDIYSLHKLRYLYLNDREKFKIDVSKFKDLIYLGAEYWEGITNVDKGARLETIVFSKYQKDDLCEFKSLSNLHTLHLYSSKIKSLSCVEELNSLKVLRLARNSDLIDISSLFASKSISMLAIEKCKHLNRSSVFENSSNIVELYLDDIDDMSFIFKMPKLEKLTFLNSKDGNLTPLLQAPNLKDVHFYPQKKHYSHTKEELQKLLKSR